MQKIILGTEGNQPFDIKQTGVSRHHATLTVNGNRWTLEDNNSTNGTFIRDETGLLRRVSCVDVTPLTFIVLGPDNANGCSFYALHATGVQHYLQEFQHLNDIENRYLAREEQAEHTGRRMHKIVAGVTLGALAVSLINIVSADMRFGLLRLGTALSGLMTLFYDPTAKRKKIATERQLFHSCPNPKCSHKLSTAEIRDMQCAKCKCK